MRSEETLEHYTQLLGEFDLLIYGRKTYQLMVPLIGLTSQKTLQENKASIDFAKTFMCQHKIIGNAG